MSASRAFHRLPVDKTSVRLRFFSTETSPATSPSIATRTAMPGTTRSANRAVTCNTSWRGYGDLRERDLRDLGGDRWGGRGRFNYLGRINRSCCTRS
jgi:hypothetical protein